MKTNCEINRLNSAFTARGVKNQPDIGIASVEWGNFERKNKIGFGLLES